MAGAVAEPTTSEYNSLRTLFPKEGQKHVTQIIKWVAGTCDQLEGDCSPTGNITISGAMKSQCCGWHSFRQEKIDWGL